MPRLDKQRKKTGKTIFKYNVCSFIRHNLVKLKSYLSFCLFLDSTCLIFTGLTILDNFVYRNTEVFPFSAVMHDKNRLNEKMIMLL